MCIMIHMLTHVAYVSTHRGDVVYLEAVRWLFNCFAARSMFNLILSSLFGSTGKLIMHTYWKSMLWSLASCQNRVSADQYHWTVSWAQVGPSRSSVFKLLVFKWSQARVSFFLIHIKYLVFMYRTIKILRPRARKFSQLLQAGKTVVFDFTYHVHALVTCYV